MLLFGVNCNHYGLFLRINLEVGVQISETAIAANTSEGENGFNRSEKEELTRSQRK